MWAVAYCTPPALWTLVVCFLLVPQSVSIRTEDLYQPGGRFTLCVWLLRLGNGCDGTVRAKLTVEPPPKKWMIARRWNVFVVLFFSSLESSHQAPLISCVPKVSSRAFGNAQVTHCLPTRPIGYDPLLAVRILA